MKRQLTKVIMFTIVIGVLALAFNTALGNQTITFLQRIKVEMFNGEHFYMYKFDFWGYIQNIQLATSDVSVLTLEMPTREWQNLQVDFWAQLGNNLALMLDYVIMVINILLYPLRIGAYMIRNVMALFGINQDTTNQYNGLAWLVTFIRDILSRIAIPYI